MERPDDPFGAMTEAHQYGSKRTIKQRERELKPNILDRLSDIPENIGGQVISQFTGGVAADLWNSADKNFQLHKSAWYRTPEVKDFISSYEEALAGSSSVYQAHEDSIARGESPLEAFKTEITPGMIRAARDSIAAGTFKVDDKPVPQGVYTDEQLTWMLDDIITSHAKENLPAYNAVIKARKGVIDNPNVIANLLQQINPRAASVTDAVANSWRLGRNKEDQAIERIDKELGGQFALLDEKIQDYKKTKSREAFDNIFKEKETIQMIRHLDKINFEVTSTDVQTVRNPATGEIITYNVLTKVNKLRPNDPPEIDRIVVDRAPMLGDREKISSLTGPLKMMEGYGFNQPFKQSLTKELYTNPDYFFKGKPINFQNVLRYLEEGKDANNEELFNVIYKANEFVIKAYNSVEGRTDVFTDPLYKEQAKQFNRVAQNINQQRFTGQVDEQEAFELYNLNINSARNTTITTGGLAKHPVYEVTTENRDGKKVTRELQIDTHLMPTEGWKIDFDDDGLPQQDPSNRKAFIYEPIGSVDLDKRVIALANYKRSNQPTIPNPLNPVQEKRYLEKLDYKDKVALAGTAEEKANLLKRNYINPKQEGFKDTTKQQAESILEPKQAPSTLEELAEDVTEEVLTREGSEKTESKKIKFKADADRVFSGKNKLTYREMERLVERDLLSNPEKTRRSLVAMNRDKDKGGRTGIAARKLTQNYEKALEKAGYTLEDAQAVSKWYAANQEAIIAAIGTNQDLFDVFTKQGAAGLYQKFNRTPDMIASAQ